MQPDNFSSTPFESHHLYKASVGARIRFGQKYITRPDRKITVSNDDYPVLYLGYQKAFAGSEDKYNYDFLNRLHPYIELSRLTAACYYYYP